MKTISKMLFAVAAFLVVTAPAFAQQTQAAQDQSAINVAAAVPAAFPPKICGRWYTLSHSSSNTWLLDKIDLVAGTAVASRSPASTWGNCNVNDVPVTVALDRDTLKASVTSTKAIYLPCASYLRISITRNGSRFAGDMQFDNAYVKNKDFEVVGVDPRLEKCP